MVTRERFLTINDFWQQYQGQPYELVDGKVIELKMGGYTYGSICRRVTMQIGSYVDEHKLGDVVASDARFQISENHLLSTDVAVIGHRKLAKIKDADKYLPFAPDLVVDIISPDDRAVDIEEKADLFLNAGTSIYWLVYPSLRKVVAKYPNQASEAFTGNQCIIGGFVLPDFSVPVSALFPPTNGENGFPS